MADQRHFAGEAVKALAQGSGSIDDDRLEGDHRLGAALDGGVSRHLEMADHFHGAGARLRSRPCLATKNGAGRVLSIKRVILAMLVSDLAIGAVDLDDAMASLVQEACQASPIGAGPLDPEGADGAKGSGPGL